MVKLFQKSMSDPDDLLSCDNCLTAIRKAYFLLESHNTSVIYCIRCGHQFVHAPWDVKPESMTHIVV